jgi:peptidoglycan/xylan/chitin deacetylase (PgdA/CDA1 family)
MDKGRVCKTANRSRVMPKKLKQWVYNASKAVGLFALARRLTGGDLRILCYHGLSIEDEHLYAPGLFMRPETVRGRFEHLKRHGYPVLGLAEALRRLRDGTLPACATVITYDDGFYGNYLCGVPLLEEYPFPSTIYVTTYYVVHQNPIFRHAVRYMFWKAAKQDLCLDGLPGTNTRIISLHDTIEAEIVMWALIAHAETHLDEPSRVALARELGTRLGVDYDEIVSNRRLSLMSRDEIRHMADIGVDIQLHTHRHYFPPDIDLSRREIADNRAILEPIVERTCNHLCYPSGVFTEEQWPWLEEMGIASATTCETGLNTRETPQFGLRRFLDAESVSQIEFEAELSGFSELLRRAAGRKARRHVPAHSHGR